MSIFNELIGHRINGIFLGNDKWTMLVRTTEGKFFRYDTANDCCNTVWVNHITGVDILGEGDSFDILRGALVTGAEDKGWGENRDGEEGYEVIQDGFWTIRTERGYIDIEVRNSHNGYYGGSFSLNEDTDLGDIEDLEQITEDF
jgi:hypothetical protein